jgi:hypothetical protein
MKINPYDENAFKLDNPRGAVSFMIGLTPLTLPTTPSDQFDIEIGDGAIQFEKKSDRLKI